MLSGHNYAGNIIINLASLPDFLRKPILKKRMMEFFSMTDSEKNEVISNALQAGPTIPFPNFAKLFKTWLEILTILTEEQRMVLFSSYIEDLTNFPQKLVEFNLDGIFEIFLSLKEEEQKIISKTLIRIIESLDETKKKRLFLIIPDNAKLHLGF